MARNKDSIKRYLSEVRHPLAGVGLAAAEAVKKVAVCDGYVSVTIAAGGVSDAARQGLKQAVTATITRKAEGEGETIAEVHVDFVDEPVGRPAKEAPPPPQGPVQEQVAAL